jgi:putative transposase
LFCIEALEQALRLNTPKIFNTDQGVQFTSQAFTQTLLAMKIVAAWTGVGGRWITQCGTFVEDCQV